MSGLFISFEGGDGAGKTTQLTRLAEWVAQATGQEVVCTREPGGTELGREVIAIDGVGEIHRAESVGGGREPGFLEFLGGRLGIEPGEEVRRDGTGHGDEVGEFARLRGEPGERGPDHLVEDRRPFGRAVEHPQPVLCDERPRSDRSLDQVA